MDLNQTSPPNSKGKPSVPDDLFEDFDFKPITSGLGFQNANKADEAIQVARQQMVQKSAAARIAPVSEHPFLAHQRTLGKNAPTNDYVQSDLSLFYGNSQAESMAELPELPVERRPELAQINQRLIAFAIDFMLVAGMTGLTFAMISYLTGVDFAASLFEGHGDMMVVVGVMFTGYFLLYFTLLEKFQGSTLGKEAIGLKVITMDGYGPSLLRAFARSVITLLGSVTLGLTAWVDLASKMTGTRVVKA